MIMRMEMKLNGYRQVALRLRLWSAMDVAYKTMEWQKWEQYTLRYCSTYFSTKNRGGGNFHIFSSSHIYSSTEELQERAFSWHSNNGCDETRCKEVSLVWNIPSRSNLQELIGLGWKQLPFNSCIANLNSSCFDSNFGCYPLRVLPTAGPGVDSISSSWHKFQIWRHTSESGQILRLPNGQALSDPY